MFPNNKQMTSESFVWYNPPIKGRFGGSVLKNVCILGGCVSRDIFRIAESECKISYFARTSIISIMSQSLPISESDIKLSSSFQKRMVMQDFRKNFFESLGEFNPEIILIDFVGERSNLLKHNQSYVTQSSEFVKAGITKYPFKRIPRHQESTHKLWEDSCERFVNKLISITDPNKIVLHEAYWASHYEDEDGGIKEFPDQENINRNNQMLNRYYTRFKSLMPNVKIVSEKARGYHGHVWGLSPVHFTDDYYIKIFEQLKRVQ